MTDTYGDRASTLDRAARKMKKWAIWGGGFVVLLVIGLQSYFQTDAGFNYVYQNNITGTLTTYSDPGIHLRVPFFSKVERYKQVTTVTFDDGIASGSTTRDLDAVEVRFADTYTGTVSTSFRFKMDNKPSSIIALHKDFRTYNNFVDAMLVKNAKNVTVVTATQYTGEEFFQGGLNSYKAKLEDQMRNGLFVTERRQVEVEELALQPIGTDESTQRSGVMKKTRQLVWKTVPLLDMNGNPRRQRNPFDDYGVEVKQVTVSDPKPEGLLNELLVDKKKLVADRIRTVQAQETAKAEAQTAQLLKEIERTKAVQDARRIKELAIIDQQKQVAVEKEIAKRETVIRTKVKDLAVIDKAKELAVAIADRDIQEAAAVAAEFQGEAIKFRGLAEAEVDRAKLQAKQSANEIYMAEIERDIAVAMYRALKDFEVVMPTNYINQSSGGEGGMISNLDVLSAYGALGIMDRMGAAVDGDTTAK